MPRNEKDCTTEPAVLEDCGWANGLSPGRTAGYGKRAEITLEMPRPASSTHALTPSRAGSDTQ